MTYFPAIIFGQSQSSLDSLCTKYSSDSLIAIVCELYDQTDHQYLESELKIVDQVYAVGQDYLKKAKYVKAVDLFSYASTHYRELDNKRALCKSLILLGRTHYRQGNIYESFQAINEGLLMAQEHEFREEEGMAHLYLSWNYWRIKQCDEALNQIQKFREMLTSKLITSDEWGSYYNARGKFEHCLNNSDFARVMADSAIQFARENGLERLASVAMTNKVNYMPTDSQFDERYQLTKNAIKINRAQNDIEQLGSNLGLLAAIYLQEGRNKEALEVALQSLSISTSINDKPRMLYAHTYCRKAYVAMEDYTNAYYHEHHARELNYEIYGLKHIDKIFDLQKAKDKAEQEQKITQLAAEKELEQLKIAQERRIYAISVSALILVLIGGIFSWIHYKRNKEKETRLVKEVLENEMRELELQSLRAMMNPHFIFNSLNSIKGFIIRNEPDVAANYLNKFSHLIRLILANSQKSLISLTEELRALEMYIQLEGLRLEGKFDYKINVDASINTDIIQVAPMIIQPFVENAIWHGLMSKKGEKLLNINIHRKGKGIEIIVNDNGIGREAAHKKSQNIGFKKHSYGMKITENRIKYAQQENKVFVNDLVDKENEPLGTEVIIQLNQDTHE